MASSRSQTRRKGAPAQVLYFPKREGGRRKTPFEFHSPAHRTLPELEALDEPATEPFFITPFSDEEPTDAGSGEARLSAKKPKRRKTGELKIGKRRITAEVAAAIGWQAVEKTPYDGLSRERASEMAVFGHKLFEEGRLEEARELFEGIVAAGIPEAFPHTMLGTIYLAQKSPDRALALFEAALALDGGDLAARVYRGEIRLAKGERQKAIEDLSKAAQLGPRNDPFTDRARRLLRIAREKEASRRR